MEPANKKYVGNKYASPKKIQEIRISYYLSVYHAVTGGDRFVQRVSKCIYNKEIFDSTRNVKYHIFTGEVGKGVILPSSLGPSLVEGLILYRVSSRPFGA